MLLYCDGRVEPQSTCLFFVGQEIEYNSRGSLQRRSSERVHHAQGYQTMRMFGTVFSPFLEKYKTSPALKRKTLTINIVANNRIALFSGPYPVQRQVNSSTAAGMNGNGLFWLLYYTQEHEDNWCQSISEKEVFNIQPFKYRHRPVSSRENEERKMESK